MSEQQKKKYLLGSAIVIIGIVFVWPFFITQVFIEPKIKTLTQELARYGVEVKIEEGVGYFDSQKKFSLTLKEREKAITGLSKLLKSDGALIGEIFQNDEDIVGFEFQGYITTKIWKPFRIGVYIAPYDFPINQTKLHDYKKLLQTFGGVFEFNFDGELKKIALNDINISTTDSETTLNTQFIRPEFEFGDSHHFSLEKYLLQTRELDKNIFLGANNFKYDLSHTSGVEFDLHSTSDSLLYTTKYTLKDIESYTIHLARKISNDARECESLKCIKTIANDLLEDEPHVNTFEILLDGKVIDLLRYNSSLSNDYEIIQEDPLRNLTYRITFGKEDFAIPNVTIKAKQSDSTVSMKKDLQGVKLLSKTKIDQFFLQRSGSLLESQELMLDFGLEGIELESLQYLFENADEIMSGESFSEDLPLLRKIIEIINHGIRMRYTIEFNDAQYSKVKFPINNLIVEANFVLHKNNYSIVEQPTELINFIELGLNISIDKESFSNYVKDPMNEFKNLESIAKYEGDRALLNIVIDPKRDSLLVNGEKLVR